MTIYQKTNTTIKEVLQAMIIKPAHIEIIEGGSIKKYKYDINKDYLKEHYTRVIKKVKNLNYNASTKILKIFVCEGAAIEV